MKNAQPASIGTSSGGIDAQGTDLGCQFQTMAWHEVGKARPCVIMQADWLTMEAPGTVIVLPLTSQLWKDADALRTEVTARGRLRKSSWVMIDKVQARDTSRFRDGPRSEGLHDMRRKCRATNTVGISLPG